jgi:hypothetical protein
VPAESARNTQAETPDVEDGGFTGAGALPIQGKIPVRSMQFRFKRRAWLLTGKNPLFLCIGNLLPKHLKWDPNTGQANLEMPSKSINPLYKALPTGKGAH